MVRLDGHLLAVHPPQGDAGAEDEPQAEGGQDETSPAPAQAERQDVDLAPVGEGQAEQAQVEHSDHGCTDDTLEPPSNSRYGPCRPKKGSGRITGSGSQSSDLAIRAGRVDRVRHTGRQNENCGRTIFPRKPIDSRTEVCYTHLMGWAYAVGEAWIDRRLAVGRQSPTTLPPAVQ